MIPLKYNFLDKSCKDCLIEYDSYIQGFQHRLDLAIKRGYIGQLNQKKDENGDVIADYTLYINEDDKETMICICSNLKKIAYIDSTKIPLLIKKFKDKGIVNGCNIHRLLHHAFVLNGYEATGRNAFPKDVIVNALEIDVCPYCNREGVKIVPVEKTDESGNTVIKEVKAELDHFYPKELYPYLALSLHNLVPSCGTCNHHPNKYRSDPMATGLMSPYMMDSPNYIMFGIEVPPEKTALFGLKESDITITINTEQCLARNIYEFSLISLYNAYEKHIAVQVYNMFKDAENQCKKAMIDTLTSHLGTPEVIMEKEKIKANAHYAESEYNRVLCSKMRVDIWRQLAEGRL